MTRVALAAAAGVSTGYIGQIERGRANPRVMRLGTIAAALGVEATMLLSDCAD